VNPAHRSEASQSAKSSLWLWLRVSAVVLGMGALALIAIAAWFFFAQHSMIYHPRPYTAAYAKVLPTNGLEIEYSLPFGKQTAFYVGTRHDAVKRVWIAFCGNGSLALDWVWVFQGYPSNGDGFLLVDYPGYGKSSGYASIDSTRAAANGALSALIKQLGISEERISICVIGHSLGAAAALDFAAHHVIERAVLISPFTTLREEAAHVVGGPLSHLLVENYDNRKNLRALLQKNPNARIAIFHGTADELISVQMGRSLKEDFPAIDFFPVEGADHGTVVHFAKDKVIAWMTR